MAIGMAVLFLIITIIAFTRSGLFLHIRRFQFDDIRESAKAILSILTPADAFTINGLIQFIFMIALFLSFRKQSSPTVFAILWVLNLFILAQLSLPATFVGKTSPKEINAIIQRSPKGFPLTGTDRSLEENSKDAFDQIEKSGLAYFYNKKPGISRVTNSPSFLTELEGFLTSTLIYEYVAARPLVYLADSLIAVNDTAKLLRRNECNYAFLDSPTGLKNSCKGGYAIIRKLTANTIVVETETEAGGLLVLTQNYHHHWKVRVNGIARDIIKTNISFMGIPLSGGKYQVEFRFRPGNTLNAMWAPPITIFLLLAAMLASRITSGRLKKRIT